MAARRKAAAPSARFVRRNHGNGHSYRLDGEKIPGVTSVLDLLDKPALVKWAADQSAQYAVEHWQELAELGVLERAKRISDARWATNKAAIVKGHRIHALADQLAHGVEVEVPDEYLRPVEAYARMLDEWEIETLATETPVCHTEYRYGGTFDAIVRAPKLGTIMLDVKTGKRVYDEVGLQLAAYRFANLMIDDQPIIPTDAAYVAHITADDVQLLPIKQDDALTDSFLYLLELYELWHRRTAWKMRDDPAHDPVVGEPIFPEQVAA